MRKRCEFVEFVGEKVLSGFWGEEQRERTRRRGTLIAKPRPELGNLTAWSRGNKKAVVNWSGEGTRSCDAGKSEGRERIQELYAP